MINFAKIFCQFLSNEVDPISDFFCQILLFLQLRAILYNYLFDNLIMEIGVLEIHKKQESCSSQQPCACEEKRITKLMEEQRKDQPSQLKLISVPLVLASFSLTYIIFRRLRSLRYMIHQKKYATPEWKLTSYRMHEYGPQNFTKQIVLKNGNQGIGKSMSLLEKINEWSKKYPVIYIELKASVGITEIDLQIKKHINLSPSIFEQTFKYLKNDWRGLPAFNQLKSQLLWIKRIRDNPSFSFASFLLPLALPKVIWTYGIPFTTFSSDWFLDTFESEIFVGGSCLWAGLYLWAAFPFLKYCIKKGIPTVVFDDIHTMVLHIKNEEVKRYSQLFRLINDQLANVSLMSTDYRASSVLRQRLNFKISSDEIYYDPQYTYQQILNDEKKQFKNFKKTFMNKLLADEDRNKCFSDEIIKLFILELSYRELELRELTYFWSYEGSINIRMIDFFLGKFKNEIQNKTCKSKQQKQVKMSEIVMETFKIYDNEQLTQFKMTMDRIRNIWEKGSKKSIAIEFVIDQLCLQLKNEGNEPFERHSDYVAEYEEFMKRNILRQVTSDYGSFLSFESKLKRLTFKAWFEKVRSEESKSNYHIVRIVEENKIRA